MFVLVIGNQLNRYSGLHLLAYTLGSFDLASNSWYANVPKCFTKDASQVATRMYKQFQEDRYLYWSVLSTVLQVRFACINSRRSLINAPKAKEVGTPASMRALLYKLAHRIITSSPTPSYLNADRFHLHLSILHHLELYDDAHKLLISDVGKNICATSLSCNEIRRDIWRLRGLSREEGELARQRIVDKKLESLLPICFHLLI
jgi:N-terminal acetyltransferase B complex non-catalytic subunit